MLRAIIDLVFGGLILWWSVYGIWSGSRFGVFPGAMFKTRATRQERPIAFWINILVRSALVIVFFLYLLVVVSSMLRGTKAP